MRRNCKRFSGASVISPSGADIIRLCCVEGVSRRSAADRLAVAPSTAQRTVDRFLRDFAVFTGPLDSFTPERLRDAVVRILENAAIARGAVLK